MSESETITVKKETKRRLEAHKINTWDFFLRCLFYQWAHMMTDEQRMQVIQFELARGQREEEMEDCDDEKS